MIKLNNRLNEISKLVNVNDKVYDIGCDHGLLDINLAKNKIYVHAVDNKEGPLNSAKENIKREKVSDLIKLDLSDGFEKYEKENCIIVSGIGGLTIINMFKKNLNNLKYIDKLIISPNNFQIEVREFFIKHGFIIENEILVKDKNIIYEIEVFTKGKKKYTKKDIYFGPINLKNKNKLFKEYYDSKLKSKKIIVKLMSNKYFFRKRKLNKEIVMITKEL